MEIWKTVPGFENYEASSLGRIRHSKTKRVRTPYLNPHNGYYMIVIQKNKKVKGMVIHRMVALAFYGIPEYGMEVAHLDGTRVNNNISNLQFVTRKENMRHKKEHGTHRVGTAFAHAIFKDEDIIYIRSNPDNLTRSQMAKKMGTTPEHITKIKSRVIWKHIK